MTGIQALLIHLLKTTFVNIKTIHKLQRLWSPWNYIGSCKSKSFRPFFIVNCWSLYVLLTLLAIGMGVESIRRFLNRNYWNNLPHNSTSNPIIKIIIFDVLVKLVETCIDWETLYMLTKRILFIKKVP